MKKCTNCGLITDEEEARFCSECGHPLVEAPDSSEASGTGSAAANVEASARPEVLSPDDIMSSRQKIVAALDRNIDSCGSILSSPWVIIGLVGAIVHVIARIISIIDDSFITYSVKDFSFLQQYLESFGIEPETLIVLANGNRGVIMCVSLVLMIPFVLSVIGFAITFSEKNRRPIPGSGIGLAKVNPVFRLVCSIILMIGSVCFLIALIIIGDGADSPIVFSRFLRIWLIITAIIIMIVLVLLMIYYIGMIKTLNVLKLAGSEGKCPKNRVSIYAAVINSIGAIFLLISWFGNVFEISSVSEVINLISDLGTVMFLGGVAVSMFKLRDNLTEIPNLK